MKNNAKPLNDMRSQSMKRCSQLGVLGMMLAGGLLQSSVAAQNAAVPSSNAPSNSPAPATPSAAPQSARMPATFDEVTLKRLLGAIDQGNNASILKFGYFMRNSDASLGLSLLQQAIKSENAGSKSWFLLHSLQGFAAFHVGGSSPDVGFGSYSTIFRQPRRAKEADAVLVLGRTLNEFLQGVTGVFRSNGLQEDKGTHKVLLEAWDAYAFYLAEAGEEGYGKHLQEPNWREVIEVSGIDKSGLLPLVNKALDDRKVYKSYGLLTTAAWLLKDAEPQRAIALLQQAKPLLPEILPTDISTRSRNQVEWYYATLASLLAGNAQSGSSSQSTASTQSQRSVQGGGGASNAASLGTALQAQRVSGPGGRRSVFHS
jgi:hypothetical protein